MVAKNKPHTEGLLIEDAWILRELSHEMPERVSLGIKAGRIVALGSKEQLRQELSSAERISLPDYLIVPGLINAHTHASMSFFRGLGQVQPPSVAADASLIENFFFPAEKALTPDLIEPLAYPYLIDALKSGTVATADAYFFIDGVGRAFDRLGMRGFIAEHVADLGGPHPAGRPTWQAFREKIENWAFSSRVQPVVYAHATDTVSSGLLRELGQYSRDRNLPFHMHLSQTFGERQRVEARAGKSPVRYAYDAGVIHERSLLVHLVSADREDFNLIAKEGALVCICPASEIIYEKLPPLAQLFESKVRLSLGTDCAASNDTADLFQEARIMALLARHEGISIGADALASMTLTEAAALFAPQDLGSLQVGKAADLVCIKMSLDLDPWTRPLTNLFFSSVSRQVEHVMIDGRWVLWDRELALVSEADLRQEFREALGLLRSRTKLPL